MTKKKMIIISIFIFLLAISIIIPTFSKFKKDDLDLEWNGLVATGFKSGNGTIEDPYIISTPNEFAYFATSMVSENYDGKYVKLTNDIIINKGIFRENTYIYDDKVYTLDGKNYYLDDTSGSLNIFPIIDGFKGTFDGDFHTIYGLFENDNDLNALFINFSGELKNLYIDNAYISGGYITAGVVANAKDAILKNVIFNGNISGGKFKKEVTDIIEIEDFDVYDTYHKTVDIPLISNVPTIKFKGQCSGADFFSLNGNTYPCSDFEVEISDAIEISSDVPIMFKNLTYEFTYEINKTAGIVGNAKNTILDGVINKGYIDGIYTSGIIGTSIETNVKNSYNNGLISGDRTSGVVDTVMYSNSYLRNVYNNGELMSSSSSGLVYNVYNSSLDIDKTFNTFAAYMIGNSVNSSLEINRSYNVSAYATSEFNELDFDLINELYPNYIDDENISNGNIWVVKDLPILYFDDAKNKTVQIKIGDQIWDSENDHITDITYDNEVNVLVKTTDIYKPIKNVWYYLSHEKLENFDDITWTEYNGIFTLDNDLYIIYVKYEDYNNNIYYINTDRLVVNISRTDVSINCENMSWNTYHDADIKYVTKDLECSIDVNYPSVSKIEYVVSDDILSNFDDISWNSYDGSILPNKDSYIIYVKITYIDSETTVINTDKIVRMAYEISNVKSGNNLEFNHYMTFDSSFNFDTYLENKTNDSLKRYIKVDKPLPNDTVITLKDIDNNYYYYIVDTYDFDANLNSYLYSLSKFKKVGKATFDEYFQENYNGDELFNINLDFKNTKKTINDYNLSLIAYGKDTVMSYNDISFSLIDIDSNNLSITSDNNVLNYGVQDVKTIGIDISLNPIYYNDNNVLNTNYEDLYEVITIEAYNESGIVSREDLKDLRFRYNDTIYVFDSNNRVSINLGKVHNQNINLDIITFDNNKKLTGDYYLKIKSNLSIDGINTKYSSYNDVIIPIIFNDFETDYNFDVSVNQQIVSKGGNFDFNIEYDGILENPNIRISLYKKKELTAYNQDYVLVDLKDYVSNELDGVLENVYRIDPQNLILNLNDNIESNGYKFVFELFDGETKLKEIVIRTIIR